jgi:hypothetical protein
MELFSQEGFMMKKQLITKIGNEKGYFDLSFKKDRDALIIL